MSTSARSVDSEPRAVGVSFRGASMRVALADRRELSVPLKWFPRLATATGAERDAGELVDDGLEIRWEAIDEDVSVANLLGIPADFS